MSGGTELYLVVEAASGAEKALSAALGTQKIASVLIRAAGTEPFDARVARALVDLTQGQKIAALIADDAELALTLKADGVHLSWSEDQEDRYAAARAKVGSNRIVGVEAGRSKHIAMTAGEAGADYIGFGIPAHVDDRETARQRRLVLIAWWSEIFEIPCVAFDVETAEQANALAAVGADFVAPALRVISPSAEEIETFVAAFARARTDA